MNSLKLDDPPLDSRLERRLLEVLVRAGLILALVMLCYRVLKSALTVVASIGRGVDAPMPVILLGALGGMAAGGILGLFVGAVLLALGYPSFMGWLVANPEANSRRTMSAKPRPGEGA